MICSYMFPVDTLDGEMVEVYVVITRFVPSEPGTKIGTYDWYLSLEEYGAPAKIDITAESEKGINLLMPQFVQMY